MTNNPLTGAHCLMRGFNLILRPGLRRYVLVPLLVNILIFSLLAWFGASQFQELIDTLLPETSWFSFLRWLLWPLFALSMLLVTVYGFTVLANLIAAPFNSQLAAQIELILSGSTSTAASTNTLKHAIQAFRSELGKLGYFLIRAVPLLILFIIPGINILAPFLWLLFSAWFLALEYADYPMANNSLSFREQHSRLKATRLTSLGFGGSITLLMMIPLLNFLAMPAAVAGATVYWHEHLSKTNQGQQRHIRKC
ncbi:Sulfate transporter, CysZ-type [hydrothermal vent metagenome]|uniref:Sulfate transporter, CysZ-type n=1 Tax=hydrothermal vent metagenome TaxID=652676 RepID=A0A3B1BAL3_9ZZZZ